MINFTKLIASVALLTSFALEIKADDYLGNTIPDLGKSLNTFGKIKETELPPKLNILVWNLYKGQSQNFKNEYRRLTAGKDLILAQEMYLNTLALKKLNTQSEYQYVTATSFIKTASQTHTGTFTAAKAQRMSANMIRSEATEPVVGTPKTTVLTSYKIRGTDKRLLVVNTHAVNFVSDAAYVSEMNRIANMVTLFKGAVIWAGDFNSWNMNRFQYFKNLIVTLNLKSTAMIPDERLTFNGFALDHFYSTSDVYIASALSLKSDNGSDHSPMEFAVEIL